MQFALLYDAASHCRFQRFPISVRQCVLESTLQRAFLQCLNGQEDLCWSLTKHVTIGFYRDLHRYLKQWPPARSATKTTVGRFYLLMDRNFQSRKISSRPDNIYMFVQRITDSCKLNSEHMQYGSDKTAVKQLKCIVSGYQEDLDVMSQKVSEKQKALEEMSTQLEIARTDLTGHCT